MQILRSASKLVFIMIALTVSVGFLLDKLSENNFMILASSAFAFYFAAKPTNSEGIITK